MEKDPQRPSKSFEEISIGERAQFEVEVDEATHQSFSELIKDYSPIHTDPEFSSKTQFTHRIGYAFLLTGFLSRLYGEYLPGGSSICLKQESKFPRPYYVGDKLLVVGEVVRKTKATKLVEIRSAIYRMGNERIFQGLGIVQIII